jgi:hypothetical protein
MEVPFPQPEIEADPIQLAETQTSQAEASTRKRKRTIVVPKTPTEKKRKSKGIAQPGETQEMTQTEQASQENIQEIGQTEQTPQESTQENTQPSLEHLTEQFFKSYEVEMAQVLGNLGTTIDKDTSRPEEHPAPTSSSNPVVDLLDIEMSFPEDTTQAEPHTEVNSPVVQKEKIEETKEQLLIDLR